MFAGTVAENRPVLVSDQGFHALLFVRRAGLEK